MDIKNKEIEFINLTESAQKIKTFADELRVEINYILSIVSDIEVSCNGETSAKFNEQTKSYADEFDATFKALDEYAEYLLCYERNLWEFEDKLPALAMCLPKDLLKRK